MPTATRRSVRLVSSGRALCKSTSPTPTTSESIVIILHDNPIMAQNILKFQFQYFLSSIVVVFCYILMLFLDQELISYRYSSCSSTSCWSDVFKKT